MAKFKCKHTGNVVEFLLDHDINSMRNHGEYQEIVEEAEQEVEENKPKTVRKQKDK